MIEIPVSAGEVLDKLMILEIKAERMDDPAKLGNVRTELALLQAKWAQTDGGAMVAGLGGALKQVNETLWAIEDEIRDCERQRDFGPRFIDLARRVYKTNDERSRLKRQINGALGSQIVEEKSYAAY
jgi:hypothetical protein